MWSRDAATGKTELKRVKQTFERYSVTLKLTFSNGETIETTREHPFYVEHKGFLPAGELGIGTSIVTRAGPAVKLVSSSVGKAQKVFNFEVEDFHTYFVGTSQGWVHNTCPGNFDSNDMALGLHAYVGPPAGGAFAGNAKTGWTIQLQRYENLIDGIKRSIDETVAAGGKLRFNVDHPFDPKQAFDSLSANYSSITCVELRYVMEKYPGSVVFYRNGKIITPAELGI